MKRNMDLVRLLLLTVEAHPDGFVPDDLRVAGFSDEQIGYHAHLLVQAGLCRGVDATHLGSSSPQAVVTDLTWAGHEFLDACRPADRWQRAKAVIARLGSATLDVWRSVLIDLATRSALP